MQQVPYITCWCFGCTSIAGTCWLPIGNLISMWCRRLIRRWHIRMWSQVLPTHVLPTILSSYCPLLPLFPISASWQTCSTNIIAHTYHCWPCGQPALVIAQLIATIQQAFDHQIKQIAFHHQIQPTDKWLIVVGVIIPYQQQLFSMIYHCSRQSWTSSTSPVIHIHYYHYETWLANNTHQIIMFNPHQTLIANQY